MAKPELGTKRLCTSCGTKYYDLNRSPILCPKCGATFEVGALPVRAKAKAAIVEEAELEEEVADVEIVSLEEADAEVGADDAADIEDPEIADIDPELDEADAFLEEEDEGDDVTDILGDVDDEEER